MVGIHVITLSPDHIQHHRCMVSDMRKSTTFLQGFGRGVFFLNGGS